jgi:prepilin-type N-terminal cleavage/methylation domain-containing protein
MKMLRGFTLLEMILAMSLSSIIVVGLVQLYRSVMNSFVVAQDLMSVDRKVSLLFNQMERDFSSAYVPFLEIEKKSDKEKAAAEKKVKEQRKTFFVGMVKEQFEPTSKIQGKRAELLSYVSFICTNPLQIIDESRQRLVRVVYELAVDRAKSADGQMAYQLVRRETTDLGNVRAWVSDFESPVQKHTIRTYVVADNIKGLFIEYSMPRESKDEKTEEKKELTLFRWGDREETKAVVPQKVSIWMDIWDDNKRRSFRFHAVVPVLSYPTHDPSKGKKTADQQKKPAAKKPTQSIPKTQRVQKDED